MEKVSGLADSLNGYLGWNKARMHCFIRMLLGLMRVKTVNLQEIAVAFGGNAQISSRYRRLQRFFAFFKIDLTQVARWMFGLFITPGKKFYLVMDRTNWYWGKQKVNIFMLGIAYEGMAIPLFWTLLPKAGSSNFEEQKGLLMRFLNTFDKTLVEGLLADREFASGKLFGWCQENKLPFFIRIKEGSAIRVRTKKLLTAKKAFNELQPKTKKELGMSVWIFGQKVFLAGSRSERGELMLVATNQPPKTAILAYLRRWEVENLFQGLKGRGFLLEATHMTRPERLEKLLVLLAVGFAWCHKVGEWCSEAKKPIIWKSYLKEKRPQYSYFRYGLDYIRERLLQLAWSEITDCFSWLLPAAEVPI